MWNGGGASEGVCRKKGVDEIVNGVRGGRGCAEGVDVEPRAACCMGWASLVVVVGRGGQTVVASELEGSEERGLMEAWSWCCIWDGAGMKFVGDGGAGCGTPA